MMTLILVLSIVISAIIGGMLSWGFGHERGYTEAMKELGYRKQSWAERRAGLPPQLKYTKKRGYGR